MMFTQQAHCFCRFRLTLRHVCQRRLNPYEITSGEEAKWN